MTSLVPSAFAATVATYPPDPLDPSHPSLSGAEWLRRLPAMLATLMEEWELVVDGPARTGACAVVVPVHSPTGSAVLKVCWPHTEARTEHLALRRWGGHGAVRLLRADPSRFALLLERLDPDTDLRGMPVEPACAVIGDLLASLRAPALPQVPSLTAYTRRQADTLARTPDLLPRRFTAQARELAQQLMAEPGDPVLLHTDLHYANVLAGRREPWLAIDPKPMAGDPAFEVAPVLCNRTDELRRGGSMRTGLVRRLEIVCDRAGIDPARARAWTIVREADNAVELARHPTRVTLAVAIIKAMNP